MAVTQPDALVRRRNEMIPAVFGALTRINAMLAAFATAAFLAILWMIGVVALQMVGESGGKILAALKGQSILAVPAVEVPVTVRVSQRPRQQRALRVQPQWRAAA